MKPIALQSTLQRRQLLKLALTSMGSLAVLTQLPRWASLLAEPVTAAPYGRQKFLNIFLSGGWDSHLAIDPVMGSKATGGHFQADYLSLATGVVPGKSQLAVGAGWLPALNAFAQMNTTFINGIFTEITAHELASMYMQSGVMNLSRSREYPALAALMGAQSGAFPAHVVLGSPIPLGATKDQAPPLHAQGAGMLADMLRGPYKGNLKKSSIDAAHRVLEQMDRRYMDSLSADARSDLAGWQHSGQGLQALYQSKFGQEVALTDAVKSRYHVTEDAAKEALFASAFLTLKSGLSPYVTINVQGFDTHSNHLEQQLPLQQQVATSLNVLVKDLLQTPDPHNAQLSLAETTTILISSEFVRTPRFNAGEGTDHWASASAILMGRGVSDNQVIGKTGDDALPRGWVNGDDVDLNPDNRLLPSHLVASILRALGFQTAGDGISVGGIDGLFMA